MNTSQRVPYRIPHQVSRQIPTVDEHNVWPVLRDELDALYAAHETVDEYADRPRPRLLRLLDVAISAHGDQMISADPDTVELSYRPEAYVRGVVLTDGRWDTEYVNRCTWVDGDPRIEEVPQIPGGVARILAKGSDGEDVVFGVDFEGNPVMLNTGADHRLLTIMWPTTYAASLPLPSEVRIVADGATGDRPVYLARRNTIIGLLPRDEPGSQWNFGYGGGGPAKLEKDITELLHGAGVTVDRSHLEREVERDTERLDIDLDRLR